ncbi:uncharacterized protein PAC_12823 [Phialocephala subalpina]|uniref:Fe2OG dioxygenase domain-containing protein n=1 Tax=Phialocephala subalpina TaxID=576137 RepID=A0A1L7XD60_9HELO|nr:uncharacterized protein PAC_12823 [Phialocephala subalpina]
MSLAIDIISPTADPMSLTVDPMTLVTDTVSTAMGTMSVTTSITMPSLVVRLKLDVGKAQDILNSPATSTRRRTLRKTAASAVEKSASRLTKRSSVGEEAPAIKVSASQLAKKRSLDEEADFELHNDDHSTDIDSAESLPSPKPSKRVRGQAKKVQNVPYHSDKTLAKPEPHDKPLVWAAKRQQLCETLPAYRAYQSGAYTNNGILHGFLIDAEVGALDKFDDQIIITTVGGDREKDDAGNTVQKTASDTKAAGLASIRAKENGSAVLVIAGQGNNLSPSKLPHYYNVLGWFKVTDVWRETEIKVWKIRFEKIDLTEKSWWAENGLYLDAPAPLTPNYDSPKAGSSVCQHCQKSSKEIYEQGWTCLETTCINFFKFDGNANPLGELSYNVAFLTERTRYSGPNPGPVAPPLPTQQDLDNAHSPYDERFKKGIVCPDCGCCSRRVDWHQWACENPECSFVHHLNARSVSVVQAIADSPTSKILTEYTYPSIRTGEMIAGQWSVYEYVLPGPDGSVAGWVRLFKANGLLNQQPGGADDLFQRMQQDHFKLTRNPARCKGATSEILTSHYASNWGALYKYGVTPTTTGFDEAPTAIIKALKRLTWAGEYAVTGNMQQFQAFNELLLLGYLEKGHIDYHDDGEKTLGPTVATLSLGSDATMHFRPKKNSPIGVSGKGKKATKPDYLKIILNHGDLLVMHGTDIHKYYEHAVNPNGKLRFALTGRYVRPEMMDNAVDRANAFRGGILPPGHEQYDYDGEFNAQPVPRPLNIHAQYEALTRVIVQQGLMTSEAAAQLTRAIEGVLTQS